MPRPIPSVFEAEVVAIEDLSPTFRRIVLGGEGMRDFGLHEHPLDRRFKLIIPPRGGDPLFDLPAFFAEQAEAGVSWYQAWLQVDEDVRGSMRTYTVRDWRDAERELVVDMVLHVEEDGTSGPAAQWAVNARIGSRLHVVGPSRLGEPNRSGIEFGHGNARELLLVGDETAVPAIASILDHLAEADPSRSDGGVRGRAVMEVPSAADELDLVAPAGIEVVWLPRGEKGVGELLAPAVRDAVRAERDALGGAVVGAGQEYEEIDVDSRILWDVPQALTQSAQGSGAEVGQEDRPFYAWIAGEAGVVKELRRYLVREVGVDRMQVAFMGYWRIGKAEG